MINSNDWLNIDFRYVDKEISKPNGIPFGLNKATERWYINECCYNTEGLMKRANIFGKLMKSLYRFITCKQHLHIKEVHQNGN